VFQKLMGKPIDQCALRSWLARRWVDQSRFHATLDFALKNKLYRLTHSMVTA
jgi:hypothetical protein